MTAEAFFQELKRLILSQPKLPTHTLNSENCEYGDQLYYCKNLINCFDTLNSSDSIYLFDCALCANCADCDYSTESQLCYEGVTLFKCFNGNFLEDCSNTRDSSYCYNCLDCHDLFGCANLTNKSFCTFNRQLTESDYREKIKHLQSLPSENVLEMLEKLKKRYPLTQTHGLNNENCPYGDYVYTSRNCYMCFDSSNNEDSAYLYDSTGNNKNCYDLTFSGESQLSYEVLDSTNLFNCNFAIWSAHSFDSSYILACANVKNCLGCVNLYQKEYCLLNRQLTKEEYEVKSKQILEELRNKNLGWADLIF